MRKLVAILTGLAVLWCIWWAGATFWLIHGTQGWFEARRAEGWQAELAGVTPGGFPTRLVAHLEAPELADPETGLAVRMNDLTLSALTIWPGDMTVLLPETPITVATPEKRWTVLAKTAGAELNLHPGAALEVEALSFGSGPFRVAEAEGPSVFGGEALILALSQSEVPERYDIRFDITAFAPGETLRSDLRIPEEWPLIFDNMQAEATVTFDAPIDRRTLEDRRPQPLLVDLHRMEAKWGDVRLLATGSVTRDEAGFAEGTVTIKAENWQRMLDMAQNAGLLPVDFRPQIEAMLRGLAAGTGTTNDLDVTLRFDGGMTRIGFLPLAPAPRLMLR